MKIEYSENNTHVEDSYKYTDYNLNVGYIIRERTLRKLKVTRSFESYVREWRGHNRLYKLHLFRKHTKDVDLEEYIGIKGKLKGVVNELIWLIIGGI